MTLDLYEKGMHPEVCKECIFNINGHRWCPFGSKGCPFGYWDRVPDAYRTDYWAKKFAEETRKTKL